jgi:hypothetical protein
MTGRAFAETFVAIVLGLLLSVIGAGILQLFNGSGLPTAFLDTGPRLILGALWPALILWSLLLLIGNLRNRARDAGWKVLTNLISTLVVALLASGAWLYISTVPGGFGMLVFGIALVASVVFLIGAAVAILVTHLLIFRTPARRR